MPDRWPELAQRFGLGQITAEPAFVARGAMGQVWRLETAGGRWAVKWLFEWAPADPLPADVAVQLGAAEAGIPLPLPVVAPDGTAVALVGGELARVYHWADLAEPLTPPVAPAVAAEAGRLLGLLHRMALASAEPDDPWYSEIPAAGSWAELSGRATSAGAAWAPALLAARGLITELSARVEPPGTGPRIICHRDFNPDNVLPAAGSPLMVLDWENCGPLEPLRELGYAVFCWSCGAGSFSQAAARALVAGYAAATGGEPDLGAGFFSTAIAAHLNVLHVMAGQALADPARRSIAEEFIASLLGHDLADLLQLISQPRWERTLL